MNKSPLLSLGLFTLLLVSLGVNLLLYRELKSTFISLYQTSLNPIGLRKYSSDIELEELPKVVFFGDSRADQWQAPANENFQFINRGISGQTTGQNLARFKYHITPLKPDIIVLQVGVNDLRMLPANNQTRADIVDDCKNNIAQIIDYAQAIDARVIVTTLFPLGSGNVPLKYRPFWASLDEMEQSLNEINQYLRSLQNRAIIFDAHALLESKDPNKVKYYRDLLHINRLGYELLNQELESILLKTTTESRISGYIY